ncbi:hypothetical protein BCL67_1492 [Nesterenkonia sandarakina]|uniref:Uncharacterized protein n=1 Tax=Nesterenkonia sandarakina TaxID=272918 RepID=A0A2T0YAC0_9MICC|nr:hypothetical protein BCL67_1492 [Nesterenkonia sandarakina]
MGIWEFRVAYFLVICLGAGLLGLALPVSDFSYAVFGLYSMFALALARPTGRKFGFQDVFGAHGNAE